MRGFVSFAEKRRLESMTEKVVFKEVIAGSEEQAMNKAEDLAANKRYKIVTITEVKPKGPWQGTSDKFIFDVYALVRR